MPMPAAQPSPPQVKRAVFVLCATLVLGCIDMLLVLVGDPSARDFAGPIAATGGIAVVLQGTLIYFVSRRHNWARIVLLVLTILVTASYVALPSDTPDPWWLTVVILTSALEAVALYWLFTGAGANWYAKDNNVTQSAF